MYGVHIARWEKPDFGPKADGMLAGSLVLSLLILSCVLFVLKACLEGMCRHRFRNSSLKKTFSLKPSVSADAVQATAVEEILLEVPMFHITCN